MKSITHTILTVGFLGILVACGAGITGIANASEVTGSFSSSMSSGTSGGSSSGSIAGTVTGGTNSTTTSSGSTSGHLAGTVTGGTTSSGTGSTYVCNGTCTNPSTGGPGFYAAGGGSGIAYTAVPISTIGAPAAGGPIPITYNNPAIAYTSYPDYSRAHSSGSNSSSGYDDGSADSSGSNDTLPGVPETGGTLSPGESLMAASVKSGGLSTAAAIGIAILAIAVLGGAAYGINSVYRRNKGL